MLVVSLIQPNVVVLNMQHGRNMLSMSCTHTRYRLTYGVSVFLITPWWRPIIQFGLVRHVSHARREDTVVSGMSLLAIRRRLMASSSYFRNVTSKADTSGFWVGHVSHERAWGPHPTTVLPKGGAIEESRKQYPFWSSRQSAICGNESAVTYFRFARNAKKCPSHESNTKPVRHSDSELSMIAGDFVQIDSLSFAHLL